MTSLPSPPWRAVDAHQPQDAAVTHSVCVPTLSPDVLMLSVNEAVARVGYLGVEPAGFQWRPPNATSVTQGSTFSFSYVVKDIGTAAAGSSWAGIYLDGQSASNELSGSAGYNSIAGMAANGGFVTASNSFGTAGLSVGQHTMWIKADYYNNLVSESDETNNWKSVTFNVTAPPLPDLVVNSITPNATSVTQGSTFSFSYVVKDIGTAAAGSSWAGIYLDGQSASNELSGSAGYNSIAGMAANGGIRNGQQQLRHGGAQRWPAHAVDQGGLL